LFSVVYAKVAGVYLSFNLFNFKKRVTHGVFDIKLSVQL